jgi:hypothetical protein
MFAYDDVTYGFPGAIGTSFGWIWTHNQYAPPKDQVDWNHRRGRRKATGNIMTVILKAGSYDDDPTTGVEAYFDNVTLREVSEDYVLDAVSNPTWGAQLVAAMVPTTGRRVSGRSFGHHLRRDAERKQHLRNDNLQPIPLNPGCARTRMLCIRRRSSNPTAEDNVEIWNCAAPVAI